MKILKQSGKYEKLILSLILAILCCHGLIYANRNQADDPLSILNSLPPPPIDYPSVKMPYGHEDDYKAPVNPNRELRQPVADPIMPVEPVVTAASSSQKAPEQPKSVQEKPQKKTIAKSGKSDQKAIEYSEYGKPASNSETVNESDNKPEKSKSDELPLNVSSAENPPESTPKGADKKAAEKVSKSSKANKEAKSDKKTENPSAGANEPKIPVVPEKPASEHSSDTDRIADTDHSEDTPPDEASKTADIQQAASVTPENETDPEEPEATVESGNHSGIDTGRAEKLLKDKEWKELETFLANNKEFAGGTRGKEMSLFCALNQTKVNFPRLKPMAEDLLKADPKNSTAHYALAIHYSNIRKADLNKALDHISHAKAAKNPPEGTAKLYWILTLKKRWLIILALIGIIATGIDKIRKRKKQDTVPLAVKSQDASADTVDGNKPAELVQGSGIKARISGLIQSIMRKIRKPSVEEIPGNVSPEKTMQNDGSDASSDQEVIQSDTSGQTDTEKPSETDVDKS